MLISAKFNSKCSACGDHIAQGELISWTKGSRAVFHAGCSAEGQAAARAQQASRATDADVELACPDGLSYLPYQRAGIAYAIGRKGVLFGDEMGLGKTIQLIGWINNEPAIRKALVICPKSLTINWVRELRKWLTRDMSVSRMPGVADVTVVSYEEARKHLDELSSEQWDLVGLDEAQNCKSVKTKRTQAVQKIMARATRRATLTGTPMPNKVVELWPLLQMTDPASWDEDGKGYWRFAFRFCAAQRDKYGIDVSGSSNLEELQQKLRATCMIRRLKKDVLKELPAKRRQVIEIPADELSSSARVHLSSELSEWNRHEERLESIRARVALAEVSDDAAEFESAVASLSKATKAAFEDMARIRKACAIAKTPYVIEHARALLEDDPSKKLIIFAHHHEVVDAIRSGLAEFGAVYVDGRIVDVADRQSAVDRFQKSPECRVFVGGIQAAGVGLTLTASSHVIFAELDWVPANMMQAEDRAHRIGQHESVLSQLLVLEGSLDARMAEVLVAKMAIADQALDTLTVRAPVSPVARPSHGSVAELERIAVGLTAANVAEIHSGLRRLQEACDGATSKDGSGFSKIDVSIGRQLAIAARLTPKQAALGARLCRKYRRQLGDGCWSTL